MPDPAPGPRPEPVSRRRVIRWLSSCAGGAALAGAAGCGPAGGGPTAGGAPASSGGSGTAAMPLRLALADVPENGRRVVWLGDVPVEVRRRQAEVEARSLLCTHFGCPVKWDDASEQYRCSCHNGVFDAAGEVVAGPPLRPLRRVPVARDGSDILVGAERP